MDFARVLDMMDFTIYHENYSNFRFTDFVHPKLSVKIIKWCSYLSEITFPRLLTFENLLRQK